MQQRRGKPEVNSQLPNVAPITIQRPGEIFKKWVKPEGSMRMWMGDKEKGKGIWESTSSSGRVCWNILIEAIMLPSAMTYSVLDNTESPP